MHIHNVYFWLSDKQDSASHAEFEEGLALLLTDENVESGYFGKPAGTQRDVVDNSYTYGLVLVFANVAGHDRYQVGEPHDRFLDANKAKWERLLVYDIKG